jgi:hypothetical protein
MVIVSEILLVVFDSFNFSAACQNPSSLLAPLLPHPEPLREWLDGSRPYLGQSKDGCDILLLVPMGLGNVAKVDSSFFSFSIANSK